MPDKWPWGSPPRCYPRRLAEAPRIQDNWFCHLTEMVHIVNNILTGEFDEEISSKRQKVMCISDCKEKLTVPWSFVALKFRQRRYQKCVDDGKSVQMKSKPINDELRDRVVEVSWDMKRRPGGEKWNGIQTGVGKLWWTLPEAREMAPTQILEILSNDHITYMTSTTTV